MRSQLHGSVRNLPCKIFCKPNLSKLKSRKIVKYFAVKKGPERLCTAFSVVTLNCSSIDHFSICHPVYFFLYFNNCISRIYLTYFDNQTIYYIINPTINPLIPYQIINPLLAQYIYQSIKPSIHQYLKSINYFINLSITKSIKPSIT